MIVNETLYNSERIHQLMDLWSPRRFLRDLLIVDVMVNTLLLPDINLGTGSREKSENPG